MKKDYVRRLVTTGVCIALALVLPLITGQIREIGRMLCPMHIPVIICGFVCGPVWAGAAGFIAPLLRFLIFGKPLLMPTGIAMAFELMTYGVICGLLSAKLPQKLAYTYVSLVTAMICGRLVSGFVQLALVGFDITKYPFSTFIAAVLTSSVPGIVLQLVLIPPVVTMVRKQMRKNR